MTVKYINLDSAEEWIFFGVLGVCAEKATDQGLQLLPFIASDITHFWLDVVLLNQVHSVNINWEYEETLR